MKRPVEAEIHLTAMGAAQITTPIGRIEPSAEMVFATALYFLLERRDATPRRSLQELLWPEVSDSTASHRLRQTVFKLRKIGFPIEAEGKSSLQLLAPKVTIDYESFELTNSAELNERLGQPILRGFEPGFSWRYADWLDGRKARITAHLTRLLLATIGRARLAGNWTSVETFSRSLLQYSPDNEEATLALAESLAMRGDKLQGVKVLDNYLSEIGNGPSDLRLSATLMRRRIADRMPPRDHEVSGEIPFVGRESFLEILAGLLARARENRSQSIIVWGAPGIGKSRLVTEFLSFAALQGVGWHRVTCRSSDSLRPLAVLLELIPLLRSMRGAIGSSPETLGFFEALTKHTPRAANAKQLSHNTDLANAGLDVAMGDIFGAVTDEKVLVIVIEDCQWMDTASATVFSRVVQRLTTQRLLLVFTTRVLHDGVLSNLEFDVRDIQLPALNEEASTDILHAIIRQRGRHVSSDYVNWCTRVAEGNPFFLRELANHWLETGEEHVAPPSLTAILRQRLSRINSDALQVLQTCALLENNSTLDNLEAVLGLPAHELLRSINDLASAGMIAPESTELHVHLSGRISSRHDLLSDVALMQLAPAGRAYLHRRAAKVLEISIAEKGDASTLWSCAKHWQLAGDVSHAFRLAKSCAAHLLEAGLPSEAAAAFEKAEEYCASDADMLSILQGKATAYYRGSDWKNVIGSIANVRALRYRMGVQPNHHDELELMELRAEWQTLNWNNILSRSLVCLDALEASSAHRVEGGSMALMMLSFQGDAQTAEGIFAKILKLGGDPDVHRTSLLQAVMVFHTNWGELGEGVKAAIALVEQNRALEDVGFLFRSLCNAAVTFRAAGRFDEASEHLREALDLADRHHLCLSKSRALPMLANMSLELGNTDDAKHWLSQLEESTIAKEDKLGHAEISAISARIALLKGNYREAKKLVDRDLAHMRGDQVPHRRAYVTAITVLVEVATRGSASTGSIEELEAAYLLSRKNLFQAFVTYALFVGLISIGRVTRADELLAQYLKYHRREPWPSPKHLLDSMLCLLRQGIDQEGQRETAIAAYSGQQI